MNSDLNKLIRQDTDWRVDFDRFKAEFPDWIDNALVVVSGTSLGAVEETARELERRIGADSHFRAVYAPENDPFFRDKILLYLDQDDLDALIDRLAEAQPMLTSVAEDPSLRGILNLVENGLENDPPSGFDRILRVLAESAEAINTGGDPVVRWSDEFFDNDERVYRIIRLKGRVNFDDVLPNAMVMQSLREIIAATGPPADVTVAITGEVALAHEEIEAAVTGVQRAGWIAVILLGLVLVVGVRSVKIIMATFSMLAIGVIWTSAYAMLTVGEYNTLSVVFLVMFFGLGVDFSMHFSLRYQEAMNRGAGGILECLVTSARSVGGAIAICTLTTAIGFLGFVPTAYAGLADLGIISAGGMLVA
jgi:hypothetical protein